MILRYKWVPFPIWYNLEAWICLFGVFRISNHWNSSNEPMPSGWSRHVVPNLALSKLYICKSLPHQNSFDWWILSEQLNVQNQKSKTNRWIYLTKLKVKNILTSITFKMIYLSEHDWSWLSRDRSKWALLEELHQ